MNARSLTGNQKERKRNLLLFVQTPPPPIMSCVILLSKGAFFPGELLQGQVQINAGHHGLKAEVIRVKVKGEEKASWVETRQRQVDEGNGRYRTENYDETFDEKGEVLCVKMELLLPPPGQKHIHLPPGVHNFPFAIHLPAALPSSFHFEHAGGKGHVHYEIKAGGKKSDAKRSLEFAVHAHLPAPSFARYNTPFNGSKSKTFNAMCLLCCVQTGPLTTTVALAPRCFAAPGERLSLGIQVSNESGKSISSVSAKLKGIVNLHAARRSKELALDFERVTLHHGHADSHLIQINDAAFVVPGDVRMLSTGGTTRLIQVSFIIEIEVHMTEVFAVNPRITVPLLIASPCCSSAVPIMPGAAVIAAPPPSSSSSRQEEPSAPLLAAPAAASGYGSSGTQTYV